MGFLHIGALLSQSQVVGKIGILLQDERVLDASLLRNGINGSA
jgi:hypothetical protein